MVFQVDLRGLKNMMSKNIIKLLSNGLSQEDISFQFKNNQTSPSSLSTIEKHLNKLKIQFKANNAIHLVAIAKDVGLI
jgi:DNA-binding NarL/FixJ family response regulator